MFYENCGEKSDVYTGMILLFLHLILNLFYLESYFINHYYYCYYYPDSIYTLSYIFTLTHVVLSLVIAAFGVIFGILGTYSSVSNIVKSY